MVYELWIFKVAKINQFSAKLQVCNAPNVTKNLPKLAAGSGRIARSVSTAAQGVVGWISAAIEGVKTRQRHSLMLKVEIEHKTFEFERVLLTAACHKPKPPPEKVKLCAYVYNNCINVDPLNLGFSIIAKGFESNNQIDQEKNRNIPGHETHNDSVNH